MKPRYVKSKYDTFAHLVCADCGERLAKSYLYCPHCGCKITWDKDAEPFKYTIEEEVDTDAHK